ncbi:MAG: hypothetical protein R3F53_22790 [Gammaproteobacteria bacterium]
MASSSASISSCRPSTPPLWLISSTASIMHCCIIGPQIEPGPVMWNKPPSLMVSSPRAEMTLWATGQGGRANQTTAYHFGQSSTVNVLCDHFHDQLPFKAGALRLLFWFATG